MSCIITCLFVIIINISIVLGISIPKTPCPQYFLYKFDKNIWFGDLIIGVPNIHSGSTTLQINFSIGVYMTESSYIGNIQLIGNNATIIEQIQNGMPINYRVYFPYSNILPYLTAINLNGQTICSGPPVQTLPRTSYYLTHLLSITQTIHRHNEIPRTLPIPLPLDSRREEIPEPPVVLAQQNDNTECGIIEKQSGKNIYPWLVGLFEEVNNFTNFYCSGTLISEKHIITATHCTRQKRILIKLGSENIINFVEENTILRYSKNIYTHPDYDPNSQNADISIISLNEEITISTRIRPICMWPKGNSDAIIGTSAYFVGWPVTESPQINKKLTEIKVIVNPVEECDRFDNTFLTDTSICTSGEAQTAESCLGNSGGPLILSLNNRHTLRGIILTTSDNPYYCLQENYFFLFTDITRYLDWINFTLRIS